VEALTGFLAELNELKRQSTALTPSLAGSIFGFAWHRILDGQEVGQAALEVTARAIASARLGGIDEYSLEQAGLNVPVILSIFERSFDAVSAPIETVLRNRLRGSLSNPRPAPVQPLAPFILNLIGQPRAGATRPGRARIVMLPAESHADHCAMVALYSVLLAPRFGSDIAQPFLAALIHHAHNAWLPDAGFTGEEMLGDYLNEAIAALRRKALSQLPVQLRERTQTALESISLIDTPEARTFHAADVLDRVLQMRWYEQAARFTLKFALDDMELVHAGPVQSFHREVLREAGLC